MIYYLPYRPPYDWDWMLKFLAARAVSGIEQVSDRDYRRTFALGEHHGMMHIQPEPAQHRVQVRLSEGLQPVATEVLQRIRQLLDLDCEPQQVMNTLGALATNRPGLRLPGCVDSYEQAVRAILGQLVSVTMAAQLTAKVVALCADNATFWEGAKYFPRPAQLAAETPTRLRSQGIPIRRGEALIHLAQQVITGTFPLQMPADPQQGMRELMTFPGIGRWTAGYFAMRGWQAKDVFLPDDYLIKQRFAGMTPAQIRQYALRWQPWRSYATLHIWYSEGWISPVS